LDDGDLAYINTILNSFSKTRFNHENSNGPELQIFTPEGALMRALAPIRTPPKINQKFNQNSTSCGSEQKNFSYFSNFEEEGPTDLADYFSTKKKTIAWTERTSRAKATPGANQTFTIRKILQINNMH
jgi:hypothetical protein